MAPRGGGGASYRVGSLGPLELAVLLERVVRGTLHGCCEGRSVRGAPRVNVGGGGGDELRRSDALNPGTRSSNTAVAARPSRRMRRKSFSYSSSYRRGQARGVNACARGTSRRAGSAAIRVALPDVFVKQLAVCRIITLADGRRKGARSCGLHVGQHITPAAPPPPHFGPPHSLPPPATASLHAAPPWAEWK